MYFDGKQQATQTKFFNPNSNDKIQALMNGAGGINKEEEAVEFV
jgi:hypothetical protein